MKNNKVVIKGKNIEESYSEKILGIIFNKDLTWHNQLYGEPHKPKEERSEGLLSALSKHVGVLKKIAKYHANLRNSSKIYININKFDNSPIIHKLGNVILPKNGLTTYAITLDKVLEVL